MGASLTLSALILAVAFGTETGAVYVRSVEDAAREFEAGNSRVLRLQGSLVPGSLVTTARCRRTFRLRERETSAPIPHEFLVIDERCSSADYVCDLPGLDFELTVEGEIVQAKPYVALSARQVLVKCTGTYDVSRARAACLAASEEQRKRCPACGQLPKD